MTDLMLGPKASKHSLRRAVRITSKTHCLSKDEKIILQIPVSVAGLNRLRTGGGDLGYDRPSGAGTLEKLSLVVEILL